MTSEAGSITRALASYGSPEPASRSTVIDFPFKGQKPALAFASLPMESLAAGIEREEMPPLDPRPIAKECAFFREALKTRGKNFSQPEWNLTTLAATWFANGKVFAHEMAKGHAEYTHEETEALWERKQRERREKGLGWPSCNAIRAAGCAACTSCPHFGKIKSPLNVTAPLAPSAAEDRNSTQSVPIDTKPVTWSAAELTVSFSNIPHRRWLYATYLIRGEITVLAAPGGAGKTALATGIAIELQPAGRNLARRFGEVITRRCCTSTVRTAGQKSDGGFGPSASNTR
jgi:AAA domain-containing protein